jgi:hypothetical protein
MAVATTKTCEECGANIYPEHITKELAGLHAGKLLCPICYQEKVKPASGDTNGSGAAAAAELPTVSLSNEDSPATPRRSSKIRMSGGSGTIGAAQGASVDDSKLTRALRDTERGATRCRTFHAKLNEKALAYMNEQINEWVDTHPEIEIKFANSTIGVFEGKHAEQNLLLTIFY